MGRTCQHIFSVSSLSETRSLTILQHRLRTCSDKLCVLAIALCHDVEVFRVGSRQGQSFYATVVTDLQHIEEIVALFKPFFDLIVVEKRLRLIVPSAELGRDH